MNNIVLKNDHVHVEFSRENGSLLKMVNLETKWDLITQKKLAGMFCLLVPLPDHRNNKVFSQNLKNCVAEKISDTEAAFRWHGVVGNHSGSLDIHVTIKVTVEGDEVCFTMTLKNASPYQIEEAWCPYLGGVKNPYREKPLQALTQDMCGGFHPVTLGDGFPQTCGYWGVDVPTVIKTYGTEMMQLPYELLDNGTQGLYLGMHSRRQDIISFVHELHPGYSDSKHSRVPQKTEIGGKASGYVIGAVQLPFLKPGEERSLNSVVIRMYRGDWHEGVKSYQIWRKQWYSQREYPDWLKDIDCWMTLHINSPEGCCRCRYTDLPEIVGKEKKNGIQMLQLIGWAKDGQDGAEPSQDVDPRLGTKEELKEAIRRIEKMGIRVLLMCKFKWADLGLEEYRSKWEKYAKKDMNGNPVYFPGYAYQSITQQLEGGSRRTGVSLCQSYEAYREKALEELDKILELEPSGLLYDELMDDRLLCFDESHGHPFGESNMNGQMALAEEMFQRARTKNPEFIFAGESPSDALSQFYPITYVRIEDGRWADGSHRPVYRYLNPQIRPSACLTGFDDRETVNQCLVFGYIINYEIFNFKGVPSDAPDTVRYVEEVRKLRRKLWRFLWNGEFTHTVGAQVETKSATEFIYSVYRDPETRKRAVAIANQGYEKPLEAVIRLENSENTFTLHLPGVEEILLCDGKLTIPPRGLAVLLER